MRAAVFAQPGRIELDDVPCPSPAAGQVRVRLNGCGVCGSNLPVWEGRPWFDYPRPPGNPGHEGWGVVDAVGANVQGLEEGTPVAFLSECAFADYDIADESALVRIPSIIADQPFPAEPLACALNVFKRCDIRAGDTVAVVGVGFLGALLIQLASNAGARVIAVSRRPFALDIAVHAGAAEVATMNDVWDTIGRVREIVGQEGCDRVIEAVGNQEALDVAAELVRVRGRLCIAGYHQDGPREINMQSWNWRGIDVINAHERDPIIYRTGMQEAADAVVAGRLELGALLTHSFPLESIGDAFAAMHDRPDGYLKSIIHMDGSLTPLAQDHRDSWKPVDSTAGVAAKEPSRKKDISFLSLTGSHSSTSSAVPERSIRLGFVGVGWIGLNRFRAVAELDFVTPAALYDPVSDSVAKALEVAPHAKAVDSYAALLEEDLDGVVIATPSGLHAEQSIAALRRGLAVFCQKPLARTQHETLAVIEAAARADRLLMTDLSYRYLTGIDQMRQAASNGDLGQVYLIDLTFHNAYGPDKAWFFDPARSGGGCLIDLGTHLVDLALHLAGPQPVVSLESRLFRQGRRLLPPIEEVEDFASVTWDFEGGPSVRLNCSWNLSAGCDAVIEAICYGTGGAVALRNENGSFFDFQTERMRGTTREPLAEPDRGWNWGCRAIRDFATRLARGGRYDRDCETLASVATILDRSYGR